MQYVSDLIVFSQCSIHFFIMSMFLSSCFFFAACLLLAPKVALRLKWEVEYSRTTLDFLVHCCDFHGCGGTIPKCKGPLKDGTAFTMVPTTRLV